MGLLCVPSLCMVARACWMSCPLADVQGCVTDSDSGGNRQRVQICASHALPFSHAREPRPKRFGADGRLLPAAADVLQPGADRAPVRLQLLDLCELHHGAADVAKTLSRELRAGDVLDVGGQVDARVLARIAVGW